MLLNKVNGEHQSRSVRFDITALSSAFSLQAAHYGSTLFLFNAAMGRIIKVICVKGVPPTPLKKKKLVTGQDLTAKLHSEKHEKFKGLSLAVRPSILGMLVKMDCHQLCLFNQLLTAASNTRYIF